MQQSIFNAHYCYGEFVVFLVKDNGIYLKKCFC